MGKSFLQPSGKVMTKDASFTGYGGMFASYSSGDLVIQGNKAPHQNLEAQSNKIVCTPGPASSRTPSEATIRKFHSSGLYRSGENQEPESLEGRKSDHLLDGKANLQSLLFTSWEWTLKKVDFLSPYDPYQGKRSLHLQSPISKMKDPDVDIVASRLNTLPLFVARCHG